MPRLCRLAGSCCPLKSSMLVIVPADKNAISAMCQAAHFFQLAAWPTVRLAGLTMAMPRLCRLAGSCHPMNTSLLVVVPAAGQTPSALQAS